MSGYALGANPTYLLHPARHADSETISAKSQNGVREVRLPKQEKLQTRKISVNVEG